LLHTLTFDLHRHWSQGGQGGHGPPKPEVRGPGALTFGRLKGRELKNQGFATLHSKIFPGEDPGTPNFLIWPPHSQRRSDATDLSVFLSRCNPGVRAARIEECMGSSHSEMSHSALLVFFAGSSSSSECGCAAWRRAQLLHLTQTHDSAVACGAALHNAWNAASGRAAP